VSGDKSSFSFLYLNFFSFSIHKRFEQQEFHQFGFFISLFNTNLKIPVQVSGSWPAVPQRNRISFISIKAPNNAPFFLELSLYYLHISWLQAL
jgi:hypothetical protein